MSDAGAGKPAAPSRSTKLSIACILSWLAAVALAGNVGMWSAVGGAATVLGLVILIFDRPESTALLRPGLRLVLSGIATGGLLAAATYLLYPLLAGILPFIAADTNQLYAAFRAPPLAVASLALVPVIVGEELVWRGVVQTTLVQKLGALRGVVLTAFVYALVHVPLGSAVLVAAALGCGLVWGALRAATRSLVPTLVAHLLWNAIVLLFVPLDAG